MAERSRRFGIRGALACLLMAGGGAIAGDAGLAAQAQNDGLRLSTARFWRGERGTLLEGLIGIPVGSGPPAEVTVVVRDQKGDVLHTETWTDSVSERLAEFARTQAGTEVTSPLSVALASGHYTMVVIVRRGASVDSVTTQVDGFTAQPLISDVVTSARIRSLGPRDEATVAETRKGRIAIERAITPKILATDPNLWYYLEHYPSGTPGQELEFEIVPAAGGKPLYRTQQTVQVGERGGVSAARLVVQGLPPGQYDLVVTARAGGRQDRRESSFEMGSMADAPITAPVASSGAESALYDRYFAPGVRTDSAIANIVDALTLASPAQAVPGSTKQLPMDAQRRYLARFWSRVADPNPATVEHELAEEYMNRVAFVSREYVERDIGRRGARTDRGRIYLKYGAPDAKQLLPMAGNRAVEVWKYTRQRSLKYAFLDETGFQNFNLVYTTDPYELSLADWEDRVRDPEAVRLITTF